MKRAETGIIYIDEVDKIAPQEREPLDHRATSPARVCSRRC